MLILEDIKCKNTVYDFLYSAELILITIMMISVLNTQIKF